jgi:hypothetical protein
MLTDVLRANAPIAWHILSIEIWARLYLGGESVQALSDRLVSNRQRDAGDRRAVGRPQTREPRRVDGAVETSPHAVAPAAEPVGRAGQLS